MSVFGYTFGRVPDGLLFSNATDRAKVLYALLTRWADLRPGDHPTRGDLAKALKCSLDSVDRAKDELTEDGYLKVQPRYIGATKLRDANDWHLLAGPSTQVDPFGPFDSGRSRAATTTRPNRETAGQDGRTAAATADQQERETAGQDGRSRAATTNRKRRTKEREERLSAIEAVYDAWYGGTGRNGSTKLTDQRRAKINARLDEGYTVEQLVIVVTRGWRADPWAERVNQNDLSILLRDGGQVEKFLALAEQGPGRGYGPEADLSTRPPLGDAGALEAWADAELEGVAGR